MSTILYALGALALLYAAHHFTRTILPGPRGLPLLGSLLELRDSPEKTLHTWAQKFGPLFSIQLGTTPALVLSDTRISAPLAPAPSRLTLPIPPAHAQLAEKFISKQAASQRDPAEMLEELYIEGKSGKEGVNAASHVSRAMANGALVRVFGVRAPVGHALISHLESLFLQYQECTRPLQWADWVEVLRFFPAYNGENRARGVHQAVLGTCAGLVEGVKTRLDAGEAVPDCLAKFLLQEGLGNEEVIVACAGAMLAGVEKAEVARWVVQRVAGMPELRFRAQKEIDGVVGRERLPTPEDERRLPLVRAIVKEIERVQSSSPLEVAQLSADFTYHGKSIPKSTPVILNTYAINNDSSRYPEPEKFNPDRHLGEPSSGDPYQREHGARRIAEQETFLAVAGFLWAFDVQPMPSEESGRMVPRDARVAEVLGVVDQS